MKNLHKMDDEKSVLRWGGLAGMLGGIVTILMMVTPVSYTHLTLPTTPYV